MNLKNKKTIIPAFLLTTLAVGGGGYYYATQSDDIENSKMTNVESATKTPILVMPRKLTADEKGITYMCLKMEDVANIQIDLRRLKNSYELATDKTKEKIEFKTIEEYVEEIKKYRKKHPQASGEEIVAALSLQDIHTPRELLDNAAIDMVEEYYLSKKDGKFSDKSNPINSLAKLFNTMQDFINFVDSATYPPVHSSTDENENIYNYVAVLRNDKHLPLWAGRYVCITYDSLRQTMVEIDSYQIFREVLDKENEEALKANKKPIFDTKKERLYDVFSWKALPYLAKILDRSQSEYLEIPLQGWDHDGTVIYADARKDGSPLTITRQHYDNINSPENWVVPIKNNPVHNP